jgi:hypothetical protein
MTTSEVGTDTRKAGQVGDRMATAFLGSLESGEGAEKEVKVRGRRPKAPKAPTKVERQELLRRRIIRLKDDLEAAGLGGLVSAPGPLRPIAPEIRDPKTNGFIGHIEEDLGTYIQRVSIVDNFYQRQPFDHLKDKIYRRLIRDFVEGAAMPEAKVAALDSRGGRLESLQEPGAKYSVIDGLQRLYCYCIAILLVWQREDLVVEGYVPRDAWDYLKDAVENTGDPRPALEEILRRGTRYEIFWDIDLEGLLHYMVTFNTGQRRMSLEVQLEIMQRPLLAALEHDARIPIFQDTQKTPGKQKPKEVFAASDLVIATRAFIEFNPQLKKLDEAEELLEREEGYTSIQSSFDVGDINDVVTSLKRITVDIHQKIMERYANNEPNMYILSGGGVFLVSFAAACGKVRDMLNMTSLEGAFQRLMKELSKPDDDPLKLAEYQAAIKGISTSRGKAIRRLVYDTFLRFFNGTTPTLDWADTARQIGI